MYLVVRLTSHVTRGFFGSSVPPWMLVVLLQSSAWYWASISGVIWFRSLGLVGFGAGVPAPDASGDADYNESLGAQRAEAVRRSLSLQGIALNRMATISYGEEAPVAPNTTPEGRAQNRRVAIVVLS